MRAIELTAFARDMTDVYVRHDRFVYVVTASGLHATLVCGAIDEAAAEAICTAWDATAGAPPHASLFDASGLVTAEARAFEMIQQFLVAAQPFIVNDVQRQAIVCGPTLGAAMVLGFYAMFPPAFPIQTFEARDAALTWLATPEADRAAIDRVMRELGTGVDRGVVELRVRLDRAPLEAVTIEDAAGWLGVTPRTLQRRLATSDTDFSRELGRARVARAQRLMLDPDHSLTAIALELGCSPSTFSELFRRVTGETPTAWRRRHRP